VAISRTSTHKTTEKVKKCRTHEPGEWTTITHRFDQKRLNELSGGPPG
jgi:hypothetical protein